MSLAGMIRRMAEAGASPEAIAIAVEEIEALQTALNSRRVADRDRKRAQRERQKTADVTGHSKDCPETVTDKGFPDKETPQTPKEITPSNPPLKGSPPKRLKVELEIPGDIPAELWREFELMRVNKKKPLSDFSRKQLWGRLRNIAAAGWNIEDVMAKAIIGRHDGFWMPDGKDSNIRRANAVSAQPFDRAEYEARLAKIGRHEPTGPPGQSLGNVVGKLVNQSRAGAG